MDQHTLKITIGFNESVYQNLHDLLVGQSVWVSPGYKLGKYYGTVLSVSIIEPPIKAGDTVTGLVSTPSVVVFVDDQDYAYTSLGEGKLSEGVKLCYLKRYKE